MGLWLFFVLSEISMLMGVVLLSRDLSKPVLATLSFWLILSVIYYPIRKRCLKKKGVDLDASTTDPSVMKMDI